MRTRYEYITSIDNFKGKNFHYDHIYTEDFISPGYYLVMRWNIDNPYESFVHIQRIEDTIYGLEQDLIEAKQYLAKNNNKENNDGMC